MDSSFIQLDQTHKSLLASSSSSNFYSKFQDFKHPIQETAKKPQFGCDQVLESYKMGYQKDFIVTNEGFNYKLVNVNANNNEYVNDFMKQKANEHKLQFVDVEKNELVEKDLVVEKSNVGANSSFVKMDPRYDQACGAYKVKAPFHLAWIPKPQDEYRIAANNVNQPFFHTWLEVSWDGSRLIHPLEKYSVYYFIDVNNVEPVKPPPVETTPFKLVQEEDDLRKLAAKLSTVNEFAVDLEHNAYRSYQGLTCLMQISTRTEDYIVDTLKLHHYIGPYLRNVFKDPTKRKVMHGADKDILWLQRDFGIYVVNMFDTGQASRVLNMERNSLEHLLLYYCGVIANKEYQTADWRLRPLTDEMLRYAREDTHYLLHIYDLIRRRLISASTDPNCPGSLLVEVYQRSYDVCMQLYQKEIMDDYSYLNIHGLLLADLNGEQLAIVYALCQWRDILARAEDESTGYVLPNKILIEIAKKMPATIEELCYMMKYRNHLVDRNLLSIISIIQQARQNAYTFEGVATILKQQRLLMDEAAQVDLKTSEEASVASVGSISHVEQLEQQRELRFGSFSENVVPELVKRKAADMRRAHEVSQARNKGGCVDDVSSSFQNSLKISNETKFGKQEQGGTSRSAGGRKYGGSEGRKGIECGWQGQVVYPGMGNQRTNRLRAGLGTRGPNLGGFRPGVGTS